MLVEVCRAILMPTAAARFRVASWCVVARWEKNQGFDGVLEPDSMKMAGSKTHTTICLRPRRGLRMNLRVRRVTGESVSAIFAIVMLRIDLSFAS